MVGSICGGTANELVMSTVKTGRPIISACGALEAGHLIYKLVTPLEAYALLKSPLKLMPG